METTNNTMIFDSLHDVTSEAVEWLKCGSEHRGGYVTNPRSIIYKTSRGVSKSMSCYIMRDGSVKWRAFTARGNQSEGLTDEEARYFAPEVYARRIERKNERKSARKQAEQGAPVKVGDIFAGSFGYDATLWEFFEVVKVSKSGKTVTVRELGHETAAGYGFNSWKCRPVRGAYRGDEQRHAVQWSTFGGEATPYIKIASYEWAYLETNPDRWYDADNYH